MLLKLLFVLSVLAISYASRSPLEIRRWILSQALDCNKEYPISTEEVQMMLNFKPSKSRITKCYIACIFKKIHWLDDNGNFDLEKTNEFAEKEYTNNATLLENAKKVFESCNKVNAEPVTDGAEGCDRASLLAHCLVENSPKAGFSLEGL